LNRHDADLFAIGADDADFRRSNFRIASYALTLDDSELLTLSLKTSAVVCGDEQIEILVSRSPTAVPSSVLGCSIRRARCRPALYGQVQTGTRQMLR
jgi:hypothetical protein